MHIALVIPAPAATIWGAETTGERWRKHLQALGHSIDVVREEPEATSGFEPEPYDALIAIGAEAADASIRAFHTRHPDRPLILALNGRDLYVSLDRTPTVRTNLARANALVVFHGRAPELLPDEIRARTYVVFQSVELPEGGAEAIEPAPRSETLESTPHCFEVCVAAPLQSYRDPLRVAKAVRLVDASSQLFVTHVGRSLEDEWRERAQRESRDNERYEWIGGVSPQEALRYIARADLLAETSTVTAGSNALSEAIALDTPVVASRIPGNVGVLGGDYEGYFPPEREAKLADRLQSAELGEYTYRRLRTQCRELRPRFDWRREREAWRVILEERVTPTLRRAK
jgi:glycosyltransferase involved in cell wall biosynthesis